ncbi:MAG: sensor histidine kinase [Bacteroidota bacterium]
MFWVWAGWMFLSSAILMAQSPAIDSMRTLAPDQRLPQRLATWQEMAFQFFSYVPDSGQYYAQRSLDVAEAQGLDSLAAEAYKYLGMYAYLTSDQEQAIAYYQQGADLHDQLGNERAAATVRANLGGAYLRQGAYTEALDANLAAFAFFERVADTPRMFILASNLSESFGSIEQPRKSLEYAQLNFRLNQIYSKGPLTLLPTKNLGNAYLDMVSVDSLFLDSALYYFRQTRAAFQHIDDPHNEGSNYNNLGYVFQLRWEFDSAYDAYARSYEVNKSIRRSSSTARALANMARIRIRQDRFSEAGILLDTAYTYVQESDETGTYEQIFRTMYELAEGENRPAAALKWYKQSEVIRDTLLNRERIQALSELQTRYETEKKDRQIAEQKTALVEADQARQELILGGVIGLMGLLILGGLGVYRYRLQQQKRLNEERLHQQQLRIRSTLSAQEEERGRLARDLHDSVGQVLAATRLQFGAFEKEVDRSAYSQALQVLDDACQEVRAISHTMMPRTLETLGLPAATRELAEKLILPTGMQVEVDVLGTERALDADKAVGAYRILQELVQNVLKHAEAKSIHIQLLYRAQHLMLMVEDDGKGLPADISKAGMGLSNIQLRADSLQAEFTLENSPAGTGTLATLHIPL